ncbi:T9SS type A sorting domain-containing protein [candidate division WOR-3 bacterium]|nr:T9SS type A sorting domain-containing protein [candidate division WOR-3 bacterium]
MRNLLYTCVVILCVVSLSAASTNPYSRVENAQRQPVMTNTDEMIQYQPATRQNLVLFVEDKAGTFGPPTQPDPLWDSVLTELVGDGNFGWFTTLEADSNGPSTAIMEQYELIIWNCYDYWWGAPDPAALTQTDQNNISDLLFSEGKCWLIGQDILWSGVPISWMDTHFHLQSANQDYNYGIPQANVHGLNEINCFSMTVISDYTSNPLYTDELVPDPTYAHAVLEDVDSNKVVGIFYPGQMDWQSAFWSIDLRDATFSYWPQVTGMVGGMLAAFGVTGINEVPSQDPVRTLQLNISPDPFVHMTKINFEVPAAAHVTLKIYNKAGQYVTTLMDSRQNAGLQSITWDRRDARGAEVPNGVYFVRLTCDNAAATANIVVAK